MKRVLALLTITPALIASTAAAQTSAPLPPMNVLEQSSEYRLQLDFHVNDAALAKMLPTGWISGAATQGPAKDANIRMIFIEAINIVGPDNKVLGKGSDVMVILAAPVKKADGSATGQMILGGIDQNDPTAAFGAMELATAVKVTRNTTTINDQKIVTEDWDLTGGGDAHASVHVKFARQPGSHGTGSTNFYNPADPGNFQISRTDQITFIARNLTTNPPDQVMEYSYKASGGKFSALFDGSEKTLSWDSQPAFTRIVGTPAAP